MKKYHTYIYGVCASEIEVSLSDNGTIEEVVFSGGCHGNAQGISALVKGEEIQTVIKKIKGIRCNHKKSSCPDQLARFLESIIS